MLRNARALSHEYIPVQLPARGKELSTLLREFELVKQGFPPSHMAILGPTGSGKTVTVRKALAESGIDHVYVVAETTAYATLVALASTLVGKRRWGLSFGILWSEVDEILPKPCYIVIDEAEKFMVRDPRRDELLYYLSRRGETGLILISNRVDLLNYIIDPRVKSSYRPKRMLFEPYTADELVQILKARCLEAIGPDYGKYIPDSVLRYIAALAAQKGGDARYAIDLLRESIKLALSEKRNSVDIELVDRARELVELSYVESSMVTLGRAHKLMLLLILKGIYGVGNLYRAFNQVAPEYGLRPLSERRLRDILAELELYGFIRIDRRGRSRVIPSQWIPRSAIELLERELSIS